MMGMPESPSLAKVRWLARRPVCPLDGKTAEARFAGLDRDVPYRQVVLVNVLAVRRRVRPTRAIHHTTVAYRVL